MRIVSGFHVRRILDEIVAVPGGDASHQLSGIVSLNEIGGFLFEALMQEQTEASLVQAILDEYETDPETASADVADFLSHLRSAGLLIE